MKSYVAKPCDVNRKWYVVDAKDVVLGRLATEVASILRGKKNVRFQPSFDMGDYVIVVNAEKVKLTWNKLQQKEHRYYTGYSNGLKAISYEMCIRDRSKYVLEDKVSYYDSYNQKTFKGSLKYISKNSERFDVTDGNVNNIPVKYFVLKVTDKTLKTNVNTKVENSSIRSFAENVTCLLYTSEQGKG